MPMSLTALERPGLAGTESTRPSRISGIDIMVALLGVLLINAVVMISIWLR